MTETNLKEILLQYLIENHEENIVYHITSDYYKSDIIKDGLKKVFSISQNQINSLTALLQKPDFQDLNTVLKYEWYSEPMIEAITGTFRNIKSKDYEISACYDPSEIFTYLKEDTKGGQYLKNIKTVIKGLKQKIKQDLTLKSHLDQNIFTLISFIDQINNSDFLICRINSSGLQNTGDEKRFQTTQTISEGNILEVMNLNRLSL